MSHPGTPTAFTPLLCLFLLEEFFLASLSRNVGWVMIPEGKHWALARAACHKHPQPLEAGSAFPNKQINFSAPERPHWYLLGLLC